MTAMLYPLALIVIAGLIAWFLHDIYLDLS